MNTCYVAHEIFLMSWLYIDAEKPCSDDVEVKNLSYSDINNILSMFTVMSKLLGILPIVIDIFEVVP